MNWALILLYIFAAISLLLEAHLHGKPREGDHNFWVSLIAFAIQMVLIWWATGWRFS